MGVPRICSVSKDWKTRTIWSTKTITMIGTISGSVTRNMVRRLDAPETRAASPKRTFMFRKAGVISITLAEMALAMRCTQMMPGTL